jgi:hypothetical protein
VRCAALLDPRSRCYGHRNNPFRAIRRAAPPLICGGGLIEADHLDVFTVTLPDASAQVYGRGSPSALPSLGQFGSDEQIFGAD